MARKALGALKDSTMVGIAKVNSEYKKLDVAILKATNHVELLPKEKHVRTLFNAVSSNRPRADVCYCLHTLSKRLTKTRTWQVALKTLIVIHRAMREVDVSFLQELVNYTAHRGHLLNLTHFKDDTSTNAWDYSTWIRSYALYLEEYLECFCIMRYDFQRERKRIKELNTPTLIETIPALQQLLSRLLDCQPVGAAQYNFLIQHALSIVAAESASLYVAIADGMLNLVDKFFEMQRHDAVRALEIYRRAGDQAVKLSEFFEICRNLDFGRGQKYVKIEKPPESFITAMEEYLMDAPKPLMITWRPDDDDRSTKVIAVPESKPAGADQEQETEIQTKEESNTETPAPPLIPDLLSFDEPSQESAALEDNNALALVISTPEELSNSLSSSEQSSEPTGWELELVTASTSNQGPSTDNKLIQGGVLDRSKLDNLYDTALARQNINDPYNRDVSSNPFEVADNSQDAFYSSSNSGTSDAQKAAMAQYHDYMVLMQQQMANMSQSQEPFMGQQQISGIPGQHEALMQQQMAAIVSLQQQNAVITQQQNAGKNQQQETQMQEKIADVPQQLEGPALVKNDTNPFGNPFTDQDVTTYNPSQDHSHVSQNQNSQASLI
ncbi:putative clathrin assembly protein At5g35200 [Nicotiana tomentosiformis]|uniref:putative clathrin assembly protein At5g35200 n=1 Tax=Nicotiana tomentosiformis TaxID=4098 RepID=UPI00051B9AD5|nr:putative clathrin assembly protein At5g35200 [Nicotiana tomentosiformis]XP_009600708.1 putative clathrin assembly protein At5g35200 [Nicotiana tomentosiformis]